MAGAGFKDFTAGDILTATQVDEYLMQQTVMRFADSAARTTALSGVLAEGMLSYLNDTNTVQVYNGSAWVNVGGGSPLTTKGDIYTYSTADARLGVGANNTVLTADSSTATGLKWATPSSGSMTLLSTTSLAGVSTVTISSISQDYNHLQILVEDWDFNANDKAPAIRINGDTGSNYSNQSGTMSNDNSFGTFWDFFSGSNTNDGNVIIADILFYSNSSIFKCARVNETAISSTGAGYFRVGGSFYSHKGTPAAITSITVFNRTDATNFDAGSVKIYGVK